MASQRRCAKPGQVNQIVSPAQLIEKRLAFLFSASLALTLKES